MRGVVEVYRNLDSGEQELICSGANLVNDNTGAMIADIMTMPSMLSSISGASSVLDASNFTIQSMSFAKNASAYVYNAHDASDLTKLNGWGLVFGGNEVWAYASGGSTSSVDPSGNFPSYPTTIDTTLEDLINHPTLAALSSMGQNLNRLAASALTDFTTVPKLVAGAVGCYPHKDGTILVLKDSLTPPGTLVASTLCTGYFNGASSMDFNGHLGLTTDTNPMSGLVASTTATFSSTGEVAYVTQIASGDLCFANAYGGIEHVGLWMFDIKANLQNGLPPFTFDPVDNPRVYKMFAHKVFMDNLCKIQDNGTAAGIDSYSDLTLVWRVKFI